MKRNKITIKCLAENKHFMIRCEKYKPTANLINKNKIMILGIKQSSVHVKTA